MLETSLKKNRNELEFERQRPDRPGEGPRVLELEKRLLAAEAHYEDLRNKLRDLERQRSAAQRELAATSSSGSVITPESQVSTLISVVVTRVSSIVLLLFLVQILVPLYRYNIRLAAYYDARGDALEIFDFDNFEDIEGLERLVAVLSPDSMTFGQQPTTPVEQLLELAKHTISKGNPK